MRPPPCPPAVERIAAHAHHFILFHGKRHPDTIGAAEIAAFLSHVVRTHPDAVGAAE